MENDPVKTARATVGRHGMFSQRAPVLAMVSGGADSVSLLLLLAAGDLGPTGPLRVLHVDHMLRKESGEDARFVQELCMELDIECRVVSSDVAAHARETGLNLEDAGRRVRYRLADAELDALCADAGVSSDKGRVVTAHTRDDSAETFLMRLAQGAGAAGLSGIPPVRGRIVRPLIDVRRDELRALLEERGQSWREDASNADTSRLRARVRHEVLPVLEQVNPQAVDAIGRASDILAEEDLLLDEMAEAFARDFRFPSGDGIALDLSLLRTLSRPMARRVLRIATVTVSESASRLEFEHIEAIVDGLTCDDFARDLPGDLRVHVECGRLYLHRGTGAVQQYGPVFLEVPGAVDFGRSGRVEARETQASTISDDPMVAVVDADSITGPLTVGSMRDGDRMRPLGMSGTKKLSDLLTDAKIPARLKPGVPVVRDGRAVVWVAGVRLSEEHRIRPETRRAVRLEWHRDTGIGAEIPGGTRLAP